MSAVIVTSAGLVGWRVSAVIDANFAPVVTRGHICEVVATLHCPGLAGPLRRVISFLSGGLLTHSFSHRRQIYAGCTAPLSMQHSTTSCTYILCLYYARCTNVVPALTHTSADSAHTRPANVTSPIKLTAFQMV